MRENSMAMKTLLRRHLTTWALADAIEIRYSWPIHQWWHHSYLNSFVLVANMTMNLCCWRCCCCSSYNSSHCFQPTLAWPDWGHHLTTATTTTTTVYRLNLRPLYHQFDLPGVFESFEFYVVQWLNYWAMFHARTGLNCCIRLPVIWNQRHLHHRPIASSVFDSSSDCLVRPRPPHLFVPQHHVDADRFYCWGSPNYSGIPPAHRRTWRTHLLHNDGIIWCVDGGVPSVRSPSIHLCVPPLAVAQPCLQSLSHWFVRLCDIFAQHMTLVHSTVYFGGHCGTQNGQLTLKSVHVVLPVSFRTAVVPMPFHGHDAWNVSFYWCYAQCLDLCHYYCHCRSRYYCCCCCHRRSRHCYCFHDIANFYFESPSHLQLNSYYLRCTIYLCFCSCCMTVRTDLS